jgi:hypothetical protein
VHCSRVFRSSAPSDLLPSSPCGRPSGTARVNAAALDQWNGGSAPVAECRTEGAVRQGIARQAHPGRHVAGAGPLSGEGRTMRDPELVVRAQRAATRPGICGTGEYPSSALLGAPVHSAAAARQLIRPETCPAGPRVSFPGR